MPNTWPLVPLGELLAPVSRPETVDPEKTYRILGAHWYAAGLYIKLVTTGAGIQAKSLYRVEDGDFVYNRLFAWKGSFAVASKENDGCYVSNEFPCFKVKRERLDGRFLWRYLSRTSTWEEALSLSTGGTPTSRNRLKEDKFLAFKIPLPPLDEQRRIVARIEALAAKIQEARGLQGGVIERCDAICRSMIFGKSGDLPVPTAMGTLVKLREPDVDVQREGTYTFAGVYCFGKGLFPGATKSGMEFEYSRLTRLRTGDFAYPKLMAWEGALGVVPPDCDGLVVSPEFPVFEIDQSRVLPETLDVYFRTPSVWPPLAEISTGTNVRRRRLHPSAFLRFEMPLPKMRTQVKLRKVKKNVDALKKLQAETAAELDALLPSILDKAFKGEL
jgi:type I restriction enzyme S subunit